MQMSDEDRRVMDQFCKRISYGNFNWAGFDLICRTLAEFVRESDLKVLMTQVTKSGHVLLTPKVYYYLQDGLMGVINNEKEHYQKKTDTAIRDASKMIFNMFRYQLSKYLGVFDLLYRYEVAKQNEQEIDLILGIGGLIQRLEYGSTIEKAQKANDYGVP